MGMKFEPKWHMARPKFGLVNPPRLQDDEKHHFCYSV